MEYVPRAKIDYGPDGGPNVHSIPVDGPTYQALQLGPMGWILSKIRVVNIGVTICLLVPCFVLTSYAAEEGPEAVIQLFFKGPGSGVTSDAYTKTATLQFVEVDEVAKLASPYYLRPREAVRETKMASVVNRFADGSSEKLRIALVKEGGVWKIFWIGKIREEQAFQDYVVSIYLQDYVKFGDISGLSPYKNYFEILQSRHRVYMSDLTVGPGSFSDSHYRYNPNEKTSTEKIVVPMGTDITGDGEPNLVVLETTGGNRCCFIYHVFEIGREFRKVTVINNQRFPVDFMDIDGDSKFQLHIRDYIFTIFEDIIDRFSGYDLPVVIFRYQDGAYRIATDLMYKPAPSRSELEQRAKQAREDAFWKDASLVRKLLVPKSLWTPLLELLYTGHPDLAWEFVEMAWSPNIPEKAEWVSEFRATLEESQFWPLDSKRAYFVPQR